MVTILMIASVSNADVEYRHDVAVLGHDGV
jgi:hypothetical protein